MTAASVNELVPTLRQLLKPVQLAELTEALAGGSADPQPLIKDMARRGLLTPFQARQLLLGKGPALLFGPYLILDLLGAGGRGQVFKARHRAMDRLVALKVLRNDLLANDEAVQRFFREVEVISQLAHPGIVHAYDAGAVGSIYYLAMEYVDGTDLERLVKDSGRLPAIQACDFIRQAALGLQYAFERGLVHRDIKPSNLLLAKPAAGQAGIVKILDLGLARLEKPVAGSTTQQLTVLAGNAAVQGTPDYLAPEQALDFHAADIRADVYSLGCTLFFLLTAQPPFPGGTLSQKLLKHQMAEPPDVAAIRTDLPPGVAGILKRMLAKKPEDRHQTPGEAANELAEALRAATSVATPARKTIAPPTRESDSTLELLADRMPAGAALTLPPPASESSRRKAIGRLAVFKDRWPLFAGAGGLLLLLLLAGLFLLSGKSADRPHSGVSTAPVVLPPDRSARPSLQFDGKTTVLPLPDNLVHKATTLSVETWFKTRTGGVIFGYQTGRYPAGDGTQDRVPILYAGMDGMLRGEVWYGDTQPISSKIRINDDRWHHVCLVVDGAGKKQHLYLDGALIGTQPGEIKHLTMIGNQLGTGSSRDWPAAASEAWNYFTGTLAEFRVWSRVLTAEEVKHNRDHSLTGKEPGLELYLPLDETSGDVLLDHGPMGLKLKLFKDEKPVRVPDAPPVK